MNDLARMMAPLRLAVLTAALAIPSHAASQGRPPRRQPDADAIQGSWRVVDARARMSNEPAMIIDGMVGIGTIAFEGNKVTMRQLGNADLETYEFTLDTLASPRRIRLVDVTVPDSAKWTGIYRITGDTLRLSLPIEHYSARPIPPASFNGTNTAAYIFTRER